MPGPVAAKALIGVLPDGMAVVATLSLGWLLGWVTGAAAGGRHHHRHHWFFGG